MNINDYSLLPISIGTDNYNNPTYFFSNGEEVGFYHTGFDGDICLTDLDMKGVFLYSVTEENTAALKEQGWLK